MIIKDTLQAWNYRLLNSAVDVVLTHARQELAMATVHDTKGVPMKNKMGDKVRLNDFAQQDESSPSLSVSFCSFFLFVLYPLLGF